MLFVDIAFFGILAWYFDHVIDSNRGVAYPFYYPFSPNYWLSSCKKKPVLLYTYLN
jgi:hypothetical protein